MNKGNRESIAPRINRAEEFRINILTSRAQTLSEPMAGIVAVTARAILRLVSTASQFDTALRIGAAAEFLKERRIHAER